MGRPANGLPINFLGMISNLLYYLRTTLNTWVFELVPVRKCKQAFISLTYARPFSRSGLLRRGSSRQQAGPAGCKQERQQPLPQ